ncbi:hypothetical protein [Paraburkholderia sp. D1E]|uniref:hypothetical protein n=1 Tax=Paraburkholderia sp. D1E TaxID=3461398 RepID=UPI004045A028
MKRRRSCDDESAWNAVVWKIKLRFDALYQGKISGYRSWEEFFPANARSGQRRADVADPIRCTRATYERCLLMANEICRVAELAGFDVSMGRQYTHIALSRDGAESALRVVEPCFRANTDLISKEDQASVYTHGLVGTGWLEVHVNEHWTSAAVFKEKSGLILAESLPKILAEIERRHAAAVTFVEKRRRTELAVERARADRKVTERRLAEDRKRRDELIAQAQQWHAGQMIKAYAMAMAGQVSEGKMSAEAYEQWLAWALQVADELERDVAIVPRIS